MVVVDMVGSGVGVLVVVSSKQPTMISKYVKDNMIHNVPHQPGVLQIEVRVEREVEVLDFVVLFADPLL